jgi:hypothetical protein
MSESDPLIERTESAGGETRAAQAANLFDLRRIIGGVFGVWGVLLVILGITEGDAEIAKAADVNINLWTGLGMLVISAIFLIWAFTRPLGEELAETEEDHTGPPDAPAPRGVDAAALGSHQRRRRPGDDRPSGGGRGGARGDQGEH